MNNNLSWYPGHIKTARQNIRKRLKQVDVFVEVIDARAPFTSVSGIFEEINCEHILVVNKCDLIDSDQADSIKTGLKELDPILVSAISGNAVKNILRSVKDVSNARVNKVKKYGFRKMDTSVMIASMPNVGKTRIIQRITGKKKLRIAQRPGVTRNEQWIDCNGMKILDTPGVLYPEMENENNIYKLACINCVDPAKIGYSDVLEWFIQDISIQGRNIIEDFYSVSATDFQSFITGFSEKYGVNGSDNIASRVFSDYNSGKFKNIVLDMI
jgi:ribosome biogenesis GTPase A